MKRCRLMLLSLGAMALGACADTNTSPASPRRAPTGSASHDTYADPATSTLDMHLSGNPHPFGPGTYFYRAWPSGGSGAYHIDWFYSYCTNDTFECTPQMPLPNSRDRLVVPVEIESYVDKVDLIAHVYDDLTYANGGSASLRVRNLGSAGTYWNSDFQCDIPDTYYPILADSAGDPTHATWYYRRNGCTGQREYDPRGKGKHDPFYWPGQ